MGGRLWIGTGGRVSSGAGGGFRPESLAGFGPEWVVVLGWNTHLCGNAAEAARRAGYSVRTAGQIGQENLKKPAIAAALAARQAMYADELQVTKEDVVGGLLRAIGLARAQENPAAMIQGCAALAKLCGFYAPERQQVELSSDTTALQAKFVAMSDAQLLAIAGGG